MSARTVIRLVSLAAHRHRGRARSVTGVFVAAAVANVFTTATGVTPWRLLLVSLVATACVALAVEGTIYLGGRTKPTRLYSDFDSALRLLDPVDQLVSNANQIDIVGMTLKTFTERTANVRALSARYREGATVRIMLAHPDTAGVQLKTDERIARGAHIASDTLRTEIVRSLERLLDGFSPDELSSVVKMPDSVPSPGVYRFDGTYIIAIYLPGRGASSPSIAVSRSTDGPFCDSLQRSLDALWMTPSTEPVTPELLRAFGIAI